MPVSTLPQPALSTGVAGTGPAFGAYMTNGSANQTLASATNTKVILDTEEFDTASCFNNTGATVGGIPAYAFLPNVAGYYQVSGCANITYISSNPQNIQASIYKNGSEFKTSKLGLNTAAVIALIGGLTVSSIIYLNGTTDYVELYARQSPSSDGRIVFGQASTYFSAVLVRAA